MSRLPTVGSDSNAWGTVLNDFLSQAHNADGSIKNLFFNVKDPAYGAKGDGKTVTDGAITSGLAVLTSATAAFTAADVGKQITVNGAGAAAANLNTTISAYTNATTVTLAANAGTTVTAATVFYGTDDTTALAAVRTAANAAGGGIIFWPPGTYISGNLTIYPYVRDRGSGVGVTIVKLKAGANTDLFSGQTSSINLSAAIGTGIVGTLFDFGWEDMTLDGNKANQTAGPSYPMRFYGYLFSMRNLTIKNGYTGDALIDWNGGSGIVQPSDEMEAIIDSVKFHGSNGIGLQMGGPHDTRINNVLAFNEGSHGFHFAPNMQGGMCFQIHPYALAQSVGAIGCLCEAPAMTFTNCVFEGSDTSQFTLLANDCSIHNVIFLGNVGYAGYGIQIGQVAGGTPIPGEIHQSAGAKTAVAVTGTLISAKWLNNTAGAINEANVGSNMYMGPVYQTSGSAIVGGYPAAASTMLLQVSGTTPDGSPGLGGIFQIGNGSFNGFRVFDKNGSLMFNMDTYDSVIGVDNGRLFSGYSDAGVTQEYSFDASTGNIQTKGNLATGQSATAPATATSGTITTSSVGVARVAPTGAVTGVILQAGTIPGQEVCVINESAFSITFAAVATSNVADGVSAVIAATRCMFFKWDSVTAKWYHA